MAKKVRNPAELLIVATTATEYAEKTYRMGSTCAMCDSLLTSVCYVAIIDSILCPACMKSFVRSYNMLVNFSNNQVDTKEIVDKLLK